jgi:hypothetical protein
MINSVIEGLISFPTSILSPTDHFGLPVLTWHEALCVNHRYHSSEGTVIAISHTSQLKFRVDHVDPVTAISDSVVNVELNHIFST